MTKKKKAKSQYPANIQTLTERELKDFLDYMKTVRRLALGTMVRQILWDWAENQPEFAEWRKGKAKKK